MSAGRATLSDILLTGGAGQVGLAIQRIAPPNWRIAAPSETELDLANPSSIRAYAALRPWSAVLSVGAYTAVDRAETDIAMAWGVNALGPAVLAEITSAAGLPLIHVSTDYIFSGQKPEPYVEDDPVGPLGVYGASKEGGEQAVRTGNPRHVILRTAWVVSPDGANFIKTMLRLGGERPALRVVHDQIGCPTSAADIAAALVAITSRLIDDPAAPTGTYHFVNQGQASWFELAKTVFEIAAARGGPAPSVEPITTADYPTPARRPANSRLDTSKIARDFGLSPRPWRTAITEIVDRLLDQSQGTAVK